MSLEIQIEVKNCPHCGEDHFFDVWELQISDNYLYSGCYDNEHTHEIYVYCPKTNKDFPNLIILKQKSRLCWIMGMM